MSEVDALNFAPQWLIYIVMPVILVAFICSKLAEAFEGFAKAFGPLGRHWRRKIDQAREDQITAFKEEAKKAVDSELGIAWKAEYASLKQQLIDVLDRVAEMERNEDIYDAYLIQDAEWHRQINIQLAENGMLHPPLPERSPFTEFREEYRLKCGWPKSQPH